MIALFLLMVVLLPINTVAAQDIDSFKKYPKWQHVLKHEQFKPPEKQFDGDLVKLLQKEQLKYSAIPYVEDFVNYNKEDYWTTREELLKRGSGDCEDFAIAKYYDLLEAGITDSDMELVIVTINNSDRTLHAVLRVRNYYLDSSAEGNTILTRKDFDFFYTKVFGLNRSRVYK